jgi:two-component system phosphate regulon response regulator PhoB
MPATVLITFPEPPLIQGLRARRPDLQVKAFENGSLRNVPEAIGWCFVDWLLPDRSGLELVRELRETAATRSSHITMVLDSDDPDDKRRALRAGADDYLAGPLNAERLLERLDLYDPRPAAPTSGRGRIHHGALVIDPAAHQVRYGGKLLTLRPVELKLLAHFVEHPDQVFSRSALLSRIGADGEARDERTVDVWVGRLRRALLAQGAPDPLRTVRAAGYVLDSILPTD